MLEFELFVFRSEFEFEFFDSLIKRSLPLVIVQIKKSNKSILGRTHTPSAWTCCHSLASGRWYHQIQSHFWLRCSRGRRTVLVAFSRRRCGENKLTLCSRKPGYKREKEKEWKKKIKSKVLFRRVKK
jgi:hypothetical protein